MTIRPCLEANQAKNRSSRQPEQKRVRPVQPCARGRTARCKGKFGCRPSCPACPTFSLTRARAREDGSQVSASEEFGGVSIRTSDRPDRSDVLRRCSFKCVSYLLL